MKTKTNEFHFNVEQKSDAWKKLKVGKVSGSQIIGLSTPARLKTYLYDKVAEMATGELPFVFVNEAMAWGNKYEDEARTLYNSKRKPEDADAMEVGMVTNPEWKYAVLSPDGLAFGDEDGECTSGLEIKCPTSKTHIQTVLDGGVPAKNMHQVVFYMAMIPTMQYMDFVSYDPRCKGNEYYTCRLTREQAQPNIDKVIKGYKEFEGKYAEYLDMLSL